MVFQPIVELATHRIIGVEALARFEDGTPPDHVFAEAARMGVAVELEMAAIEAAFEQRHVLIDDVFLAVNLSPAVLMDSTVRARLLAYGFARLVIQLTAHKPVEDYESLRAVCLELRETGIRIAIDDAGAGYASLHHILQLSPDIIKLDIALTSRIDTDPVERALATALVQFASDIDATVVAEGIETATQREALQALEVPWGQGFHLWRPKSANELTQIINRVEIET